MLPPPTPTAAPPTDKARSITDIIETAAVSLVSQTPPADTS